MKNVYLVNMSFGLAGVERRFANIWQVLHRRGVVNPILVIPTGLAQLLAQAGLLPNAPGAVVVVPEAWPVPQLGRLHVPSWLETPRSLVRSRMVAWAHRPVWQRIARDPDAVVHIGMPCSALRSPDVPTLLECVDANMWVFGSYHFRRAATRRWVIHCQTERIHRGLDAEYAERAPRWETVTSASYFAHYADATGAARDPRLIAFVGRFMAIKNPILFLEAVARARQHGCDCRVLMLGEGPMRREVDAAIARHNLADAVTITFTKDVASRLATAGSYVSLQTGDNYGSQAMLEAMGAGCAIIASDVGETNRIITDEVGLRVSLTVDAVADAVEQLVGNPERTRRLGARAAEVARTQYSADAYAASLEALYERAVQYHRISS